MKRSSTLHALLSAYGVAFVAVLVVVVVLLCLYPKLELHMLLNAYHTGVEDTFFKYYSVLAEWPIYLIALLPLFWKRKELTFFFAASEITAGAILQMMKHLISMDRPASAFEHSSQFVLPIVNGVELHHSNSFPSGHASTFFVFCTCCALVVAYHYKQKKNPRKIRVWLVFNLTMLGLFVLAALGGYSRIYLSQHFLSDVIAGSIIGFVVPCVIFHFFKDKIVKTHPAKEEIAEE